ncbi:MULTISPECIES: dodecin family protein [Maribacter]|jgi:flavin-binding protein dodecin|uniref:Dodecin domain-containing protein n=1 Tax=Maribacter litoralis TaxID=2059726 RepID=A0A653SW57_9FLAO|nr:dodecin family protein [Maribacter litoralis]VXB72788.1 Dodecin domain-containing protein [Maribacter litoralis]
MAVLKVIEILANSDNGWEDAAKQAVAEASKSVKNIKSVYINEQSATVEDGKIKNYRVNVKITFEVK